MNFTKIILGAIAGFFILRSQNTEPTAVDNGTTTTAPPVLTVDYNRIGLPLQFFDIRNDNLGLGAFKASRDGDGIPGGANDHAGIDLVCRPGETVFSPIEGVVVREAKPYAGESYSGILIRGTGGDSGKEIKMFYMQPFFTAGSVGRGTDIGSCQDISQRRPEWVGVMIPHLHMELRINGALADPAQYV